MQRRAVLLSCIALGVSCSSKSDRASRGERAEPSTTASARTTGGVSWKDACRDTRDCRVRCDANEARACTRLADLLFKGARAERDLPGALAAAQRACAGGDGLGCSTVALMLQDGIATPRDAKRAAELYDKGCELGVGVACFNRAFMYRESQPPDEAAAKRSFDKARAAYQASCDAGDQDWCTNLGVMFAMGAGVERDEAAALVIFRKACDTGNDNGCIEVAQALQRKGTQEDAAAARDLLLATCDRSPGLACALAALALSAGEDQRVAELSKRACDAGATLGCTTFARLSTLPGILMPPSSLELLTSSCEAGDSDACALAALVRHKQNEDEAALRVERQGCLIGDREACANGLRTARTVDRRDVALELAARLCELGESIGCDLVKAGRRSSP
ncbi:MAG: tetratricopeptide repeat protein [Polyangiaceae bacterium]